MGAMTISSEPWPPEGSVPFSYAPLPLPWKVRFALAIRRGSLVVTGLQITETKASPAAGLTIEALRRIPMEDAKSLYVQVLRGAALKDAHVVSLYGTVDLDPRAHAAAVGAVSRLDHGRRKTGRRPLPDDYYRDLAAAYAGKVAEGVRNPSTALASAHGVNPNTM